MLACSNYDVDDIELRRRRCLLLLHVILEENNRNFYREKAHQLQKTLAEKVLTSGNEGSHYPTSHALGKRFPGIYKKPTIRKYKS